MNQKKKKQAMYWLKVAIIGIALGFGLQFVRAWTEPTTAPPNGNVGAPINTGATAQTKAGAMYSNDRVGAPYLCIGTDCRNAWPSGGTGNCVCFAQHNQYGYGGRNPICYTYDYMNCGSGWTQIGYKGTNYTYCGGYSGYFPCSPTYP